DLCTSLQELKFKLNLYDEQGQHQLKRNCCVSPYTIRQLAKLKKLTQLQLSTFCVNLEPLSLALELEIVQMKSLKSLHLYGSFEEFKYSRFCKVFSTMCPNLESLNLHGPQFHGTPLFYERISTAFPKLKFSKIVHNELE